MIYIWLITTHCFSGRLLLTEKIFGILKRKNSNRSSKQQFFVSDFFVRHVCDTLTHGTNLIIDGFAKWCFDQPCRVASSHRHVTLFRSMKKLRSGKKQQVHFFSFSFRPHAGDFYLSKKEIMSFLVVKLSKQKTMTKNRSFFLF